MNLIILFLSVSVFTMFVFFIRSESSEVINTNFSYYPLLYLIPGVGILASLGMFLAGDVKSFETSLIVKTGVAIILTWLFNHLDFWIFLLFTGLILEICINHAFPWNLVVSGVLILILLTTDNLTLFLPAPPISRGVTTGLEFPIALTIEALCISFLIRYREQLIQIQNDNIRLDKAMVGMNRANQEYHDYLLRVELESTENERKRITRDIHDTVGYTLTNNIMLMEAVTDMMRQDPMGVTNLINMARDNAQEGLTRIRETLYNFRAQKSYPPNGLQAISKMTTIFEVATGIKVISDFGNMPWTLGDELDSIIYHLIQESMMNSFRHGRAAEVRVSMHRDDGWFNIRILDNGRGSTVIKEGIGIKGMSERIAKAGGSLKAQNLAFGFEVIAKIPVKGNSIPNERSSE